MALRGEPSHTKSFETRINKYIEAKNLSPHELGKAIFCCNVFGCSIELQ